MKLKILKRKQEIMKSTNLTHALENLEERHSLSELLPYDPSVKKGERLKDGLKEYHLLLVAAEQAIASIRQKELKHFDPLVGENACQIRAVKLALIFSKKTYDCDKLLGKVLAAKTLSEKFQNTLPELLSQNTSLQDLLTNENFSVSLTYGEFFLIKSYLLTKVKVSEPFRNEKPLVKNERTDTKKIKEISSVGSMFADNLVRNLREYMSTLSVHFVQNISKKFSCSMKMVSDQFLIAYKRLQCLPCFWTTRLLMRQALSSSIPLVMIVQQKASDLYYKAVQNVVLFFRATPEGYQPIDPSSLPPDAPALILVGTTCRKLCDLPEKKRWIEELLEYSPVDLLLAYAAVHRQYPDTSQEHILEKISDDSYAYYKTKAEEWGCSMENPSRFFLAHAFCDTVRNFKPFASNVL